MIPYSAEFSVILILSLTLLSSVHAAQLTKDGGDEAWTQKRPVKVHKKVHTTSSLLWNSQTSRTNMDTTTPPATTYSDTGHSSPPDLLATSSHPAFQIKEKLFKAPTYTTSPSDQKRIRLSDSWVRGEFKANAQRPDDTSLNQKPETDLRTTRQDGGKMFDEITVRPPDLRSNSTKDRLKLDSTPSRKISGLEKVHEGPYEKNDSRGSLKAQTSRPTQDVLPHDGLTESFFQPDCNIDTMGVCNSSNPLWSLGHPDNLSIALNPASSMPPPENMTPPASVIITPPLLVPLFSDWNAAMATWGLAWELQVYGLGCVFSLVAVLSALSLLCLPLCQPSGCANFTLLHLLQLLIGSSRAFWLIYDPYGQKERLPVAWARLLHEAGYPCLTGAFGMLLVLLSPQVLSQNALRRCICLLAVLMLLHMATVLGTVGILWIFPSFPVVSLLPPAAFLLLSFLLSTSYLLLYCCARIEAKHIYRLRENSPDRLACQTSHCPLSEAGVWERAAAMGMFSAFFLLACAGLRLYAILHSQGLTGGRMGLMPWPWWIFQLSCRVCEACVCLSLALILTHPLLCCGVAHYKIRHWNSWFNGSSTKNTVITKPQMLSSGWTRKPGETLHESMSHHESESVPLYTLAEMPLGEPEGLELYYPSSPQLAPAQPQKNGLLISQSSFVSLDCDSTVDLRPPSPIDLRRSIDEALNSEALFHCSLFSSSRLSLSTRGPPDGQPCKGIPAEPSLYRTASCGDMDLPSAPSPPVLRSSAAWKASNFSSLRGGNRSHGGQATFYTGFGSGRYSQKQYRALGSISSRERLYDQQHTRTQADEMAVQAEFINVCRQIDSISVCSDTIDL
ncbi:Proline-rich transmembrane protein 4 [Bagarius yarrelli]|uniref:Proline-rich transmembrane protein 4 n=1 Tax=Bagarius yarrelli TaxID=175774 RepID=A0A556TQN8_BAGYA|nr:Proline-rich transmembrane protein 4 [Bagarius yarrelli]